jgi:CubicO group peptidase (beta-lactamase class C family)
MENTTQIKLPACSSGQSLGQCIDATVSSFMTQTSAPPNSACVIVSAQYRGATIYAQGYGKISNNGPAPTTANSFQIDSLTKVFTAFAVIRLFEQGTIVSLTDQLGAYMTSLSNGSWNQAWSSIQINQLLAMVSGIPDSSSEKLTYMEQLENLVETPLKFPAGTQYQYSNSNYFLLSALVDTLVGVSSSYIDYMRQQVLKVFNLPNTGLFTHAEAPDPVTPNFGDGSWRNPLCGYGSGGFASTMADLENFAIGLSQGLVLSPADYQTMWTPYSLPGGTPGTFGLGWAVHQSSTGALEQVEKNGGGSGWNSAVAYAPPNGGFGNAQAASVCVLMNYDVSATTNVDVLANNLLTKVVAANE